MAVEIPVTFDYKGKEQKGFLSAISGASAEEGTLFYLIVAGYHLGQLFQAPDHSTPGYPFIFDKPVPRRWVFYSNKGEPLPELATYFTDVVMAWYQ